MTLRRPNPALLALLAATAGLYLWDLSASGYANQFYAAAAQAGSASWKAFFFGSSDAANSITVDKPPAAMWPMGLSVRLFGLSSWSILVPEVIIGCAAVGVLYAAVRRHFGAAAGLLAGGVLALTPVAALMFRFDNPDALLCLLMVCAIACVLRALENASTKWLMLAGFCFGLGFLTKTLQAWLILPALALVYLVCAPTRPLRRVGQLLLAGLVLVVAGGWWVAVVELMPAASRPYVGGSQHNSFLELTFGYNGLGRINGNETGSVGGGPGGHGGGGHGGGGHWGQPGIGRLFAPDTGGQIAWLLPAALVLLVTVLWLLRRAGRTDIRRAAFLVWGGALLMTAVVFSLMSGIFHQYYTVALAPYVAALVAMGVAVLWERRAVSVLALVTTGTAAWAYVLLGRTPHWLPWLKWAVLAAGVAAGVALLPGGVRRAGAGPAASGTAPRRVVASPKDAQSEGDAPPCDPPHQTPQGPHRPVGHPLVRRGEGRAVRWAAALAVGSALAGPFAYTLNTVNSAHGGSIVTAGPAVRGGFGGFGGGGGRGGHAGKAGRPGGFPPGGFSPGKGGGMPKGRGDMAGGLGGPGGMAGLLGGQRVSPAAAAAVAKDAGKYTWAAAAVGSQSAAGYQLATQRPVMPIGGFNGSDPSPTLAHFQELVKDGRIHWFIGSGGGRGGDRGGKGTAAEITTWVEAHFTKVTVGGATFYDLTRAGK